MIISQHKLHCWINNVYIKSHDFILKPLTAMEIMMDGMDNSGWFQCDFSPTLYIVTKEVTLRLDQQCIYKIT